MEVETASLYHVELWRDIEELKTINAQTIHSTKSSNSDQ